jgi:hypothetical protein
MKGYKGFNKNLVCRGKQYAENTIFEEERAEICKKSAAKVDGKIIKEDVYYTLKDGEFIEYKDC